MIHEQTEHSMIIMGISGMIIGSAIANQSPIVGFAGLVGSLVAFRTHPGAETIADDWPPEDIETDDNGSDRL